MRLLVISDIEALHWTHGKGQADVLLSCEDVDDGVILEAAWAFGCSAVVAVKGNHDTATPFPDPVLELHLRVAEHEGVRFGGLNGAWRYKPRGKYLYEQSEVGVFPSAFPAVDVFDSHESPRGIHDREEDVRHGCEGPAPIPLVLQFIITVAFERRCIRPGFVALPRRIPDTPSVGRLAGECFALVPPWRTCSISHRGCGASTLSVRHRIYELEYLGLIRGSSSTGTRTSREK